MKLSAVLAYPFLRPIILWDRLLRRLGLRADRWHWADVWLCKLGIVR
jgi:hypothetical protein